MREKQNTFPHFLGSGVAPPCQKTPSTGKWQDQKGKRKEREKTKDPTLMALGTFSKLTTGPLLYHQGLGEGRTSLGASGQVGSLHKADPAHRWVSAADEALTTWPERSMEGSPLPCTPSTPPYRKPWGCLYLPEEFIQGAVSASTFSPPLRLSSFTNEERELSSPQI